MSVPVSLSNLVATGQWSLKQIHSVWYPFSQGIGLIDRGKLSLVGNQAADKQKAALVGAGGEE